MSLEEGTTDVFVEPPRELLDPVLSSLSFLALLDACSLSGLESQAEDVLEEVERVLVHGVDTGHVSEHEEETTDTQTNGDVLLTDVLDTLHTLLSLSVRVVDLLLLFLGLFEGVTKLNVLKNVFLGVGEQIEDMVVNGFLLDSVVSRGLNILDTLVVTLFLFDTNDFIEHLILKTVLSDHEVEDGDLDADFGTVMGSGDLSRNVELEVVTVIDDLVTELHLNIRSLLFDLLGKQWVEHGIKLLRSVFKDDRCTELDASLESTRHGLGVHRGFNNLDLLFVLCGSVLLFQPLVGLHLRIDA